jgi:XTP/dITP diphosphohydrolase
VSGPLLIATNNPGKVAEFQKMTADKLLCMADLGLQISPEETGSTFEENSLIKARETAAFLLKNGHTGITVLADDSGLEIDALGGAPGVDSAIYLGADATYPARHAHILDALKNTPQAERTARFVCVITCIKPCGETISARAHLEGRIATAPAGSGGFGYDPIFFVPIHFCTMAQLDAKQKNEISHRGLAFQAIMKKLRGAA